MRAALLLCLLATGCMSPVRQVATHQVARDFYRARYMETCPAPRKPAPWCQGFDGLLNRYDLDLAEGDEALVWVQKSGAKMPLQLHALKFDRKALAKEYGRTRPVPAPHTAVIGMPLHMLPGTPATTTIPIGALYTDGCNSHRYEGGGIWSSTLVWCQPDESKITAPAGWTIVPEPRK